MQQLQQLVETLDAQEKIKKDFVAPTTGLHFADGNLIMTHAGQDVLFTPSSVFHSQISEKLGIPKGYYDRMKDKAIQLLDDNVNHWLTSEGKNILLRTFMDGDNNTARAFLSDRYNIIDNMEVLMTVLDTLKDTGIVVNIDKAELSETRLYLNVVAPEIELQAEKLLKQYRKAITSGSGVVAGFGIQNSEIGFGAQTVMPRLKVLACNNGLVVKKDALRKIHLGGQLDELEFYKNTEIRNKNRALVKEQVKHAVKKFLSFEYLQEQINRLTEIGDQKIEAPIQQVVEVIAKDYGFTQEDRVNVLDHFLRGGDDRRVGMMNAVTEFSQTIKDADKSNDVEVTGVDILENFDRIEAAAIKLSRSSN